MATTIDDRLSNLSATIDGWIRPYLNSPASPVDRFYQMMAYHHGWCDPDGRALASPAASGKRVRPALAVLTCEAFGGPPEAARGPAVAVELIHNFSLVHDDIQDRSDQRRGRDTVWKLWGAAQGINVGDALFSLAQLALVDHADDHPRLAQGVRLLNQTCIRLCEGQFLDLELESFGDVSFSLYEAMIERKTGALISCSAALGAWAARTDDAAIDACARFGRELGLAFQFQDDLLGVWGDPKQTGKPIRDDVRSRKKGLPMVLAIELADGPTREEILRVLSTPAPLPEDQVERLVSLMDQLGVHARAQRMVDERFAALDRAIREALPSGRAVELLALCERLRVRVH